MTQRACTVDNHNCHHFSITNTFADIMKGEPRRVSKVFSYSNYLYPDKAGYKWLKSQFVIIYGEDRAMALYNHPKLMTKMKWGCGVTARFQQKKSGGGVYPVFRLHWKEYDIVKGTSREKERYISLTKLNEAERREAVHDLAMEAVEVRARLSMSTLDKGVLGIEYDLSAMPSESFIYDKTKLKVLDEL
ncbi:hypothetical protein [Vibrio crassostreae]|uniref:hypothetical protein n=1 Tax=Vibrio crassostreae TaxID=246167 RepID=UPI001B30FCCD|nr:hypothetical protein [Vibrio crassostreae]